jgi:hypothetical protein
MLNRLPLGGSTVYGMAISPVDGAVYACGATDIAGNNAWIIKRSATGASGTFTTVDTLNVASTAFGIAVAPDGAVYASGYDSSTGQNTWLVRRSSAGTSGTFVTVDLTSERNFNVIASCLAIDSNNKVYVAGSKNNSTAGLIRRGKLTANSASLGPIFINSSYGYVKSEISGTTEEAFNLANISEFPHSSGLYQMKNMLLGTITSGKFGTSADSIVQVKHVGSTVKIMWPRQQNADSSLKTYGDLSPRTSAR